MKKIICFCFFIFLSLGTCVVDVTNATSYSESSENTKLQMQQAILDVAHAYYMRGNFIDYDSQYMTYQTGSFFKIRSHGYPYSTSGSHSLKDWGWYYSPEDATSQNRCFAVCSHFINLVMHEAFVDDKGNHYQLKDGKGNALTISNKMIAATKEGTSSYNEDLTVLYFDGEKPGDILARKEEILNKINQTIEAGDIIIFSNNSGAHAFLYVGNGIEYSAGGSAASSKALYPTTVSGLKYNLIAKTDFMNRTIGKGSMENALKNKIVVESTLHIAILRPINEVTKLGYHISENTLNRMSVNRLFIEKISSVGPYESVNLGDKITYTIRLKNNSTERNYKGIVISDAIPANTEYVSLTGDGKQSKGKLEWTVDLDMGETKEITYTVRVKKQKSLLGKYVISDSTVVAGIKINSISTRIDSTIVSSEIDKLKKIEKEEGASIESVQALLKRIYPEIQFPSVEELIDILFVKGTIDIKNKNSIGDVGQKEVYYLKDANDAYDNEESFIKMEVPGLFGGYYTLVEKNDSHNDGRTMVWNTDTFTIGDVLLVIDDDYEKDQYVAGEKNLYLYIDDGKFATVENNSIRIIKDVEAIRLIDSLLGQNCVIVLRPSFYSTSAETSKWDNYSVGTENYFSLEECYEAINANVGTITVLKDVEDDSTLKIGKEKEITINLNGHTITKIQKGIYNEGILTLKGEGKIQTLNGNENIITQLFNNAGTLNILDCTLENKGSELGNWYVVYNNNGIMNNYSGNLVVLPYTQENAKDSGIAVAIKRDSIININGGKIEAQKGYAIFGRGTQAGNAKGEVNVRDGIIKGKYGIYLVSSSGYVCSTNVTVTGGTFETDRKCIILSDTASGNLTIASGNIISNQDEFYQNLGSGQTTILEDDVPQQEIVEYTEPIIYTITVNQSRGGNITPKTMELEEGDSCVFTIKADSGYLLSDVIVNGNSVGKVSKYKFDNIRENQSIKAVFKLEKVEIIEEQEDEFEIEITSDDLVPTIEYLTADYLESESEAKPINEPSMRVQAVSEWAVEKIYEAMERELIPETFDNYDYTLPISRFDFAATAVKLYEAISGNKAEIPSSNPFIDTDNEYVLKAYALGITSGTTATTFSPEALITREQMARMIENALIKAGIDTTVDLEKVEKFADDDLMNDWAKNAIYFMSSKEIIKGMGNNLFGVWENATREQAIIISEKCANAFENAY